MKEHPGAAAALAAILGKLSLNLIEAAQFVAATLTGLASLCAFIIAAPKAWAQLVTWYRWLRLRMGR